RGEAMVELKAVYERAGFRLAAKELPDYLPVVLEYLSCRSLAEARDMLGDCAHILGMIGEAGLDESAAARRGAEAEDLDRDWFEEPAFASDGPAAAMHSAGRAGQ